MSDSTRRTMLGAAAAILTASTVRAAAAASPHSEAGMIRLCAEHVANLHRYNTDEGGTDDPDLDPVYHAYLATMYAVDDFKPRTLEGKGEGAGGTGRGADARWYRRSRGQ